MTATALRAAAQSDHDILEQLNRDYIDSVQHSDVQRFDEILRQRLPSAAIRTARWSIARRS